LNESIDRLGLTLLELLVILHKEHLAKTIEDLNDN